MGFIQWLLHAVTGVLLISAGALGIYHPTVRLPVPTEGAIASTTISENIDTITIDVPEKTPLADSVTTASTSMSQENIHINQNNTAPIPSVPPSSLQILSPNGGEQISPDGNVSIRWNASNIADSAYVNIVLLPTERPTSYSIATKQPIRAGSFIWKVADSKVPAGEYRLLLQVLTPLENFIVEDESNAPFQVGFMEQAPSVRIVSPNGGEKYHAGSDELLTVSWTAKNIPVNSTASVTLESADGAHHFAFPGRGGILSVTNGFSSVTDHLIQIKGYDLAPGKYTAKIVISGSPDGSGKEARDLVEDSSDQPFILAPAQ